jgi:hypothetical protein
MVRKEMDGKHDLNFISSIHAKLRSVSSVVGRIRLITFNIYILLLVNITEDNFIRHQTKCLHLTLTSTATGNEILLSCQTRNRMHIFIMENGTIIKT